MIIYLLVELKGKTAAFLNLFLYSATDSKGSINLIIADSLASPLVYLIRTSGSWVMKTASVFNIPMFRRLLNSKSFLLYKLNVSFS